jgi:hypothetical protein
MIEEKKIRNRNFSARLTKEQLADALSSFTLCIINWA